MSLLAVLHQRQRQQSDCLAACAALVLEYLNDPYFVDGSRPVSLAEMELAWLEQGYLYAIIERQ